MPAVSTKSPIAIAVDNFNSSAIKLLLQRDAEWKDTDPNCRTPLQALMHHDRGLLSLSAIRCAACYQGVASEWGNRYKA